MKPIHPHQFQANEAWILFKLNDAPLLTETDGDFNVVALMDAASGYILGTEFVPVRSKALSRLSARRLLKAAASQARVLPKTLLISMKLPAALLGAEAARAGVDVERVEEDRLSAFTDDARTSFKQRFGGSLQ